MQLLIGKDANVAGLALPNDRGFILAPGFDMTVQAVVRQIDLAADKPFRPRAIPFENLVPLLNQCNSLAMRDQNFSGSATDSL